MAREILKVEEKIVFALNLRDLVHNYVFTNMEIMSPWI
jgi:hypothetical protein